MKKPIRTIICPVDFSETASGALRAAIDLAGQFGASVEVVHVVDIPHPSTPAINDGIRDNAKNELESYLHHWPDTDVPLTSALIEGSPASAIAKHAADAGSDLIVISTHGRSGITRAMLGSVAERLVRMATCPVLTVPASEPA